MLHADKLFSVQTMPIWQLCLIAAAAVTFMVSVLYWMMPPPLRRSRTAVSPALATLLLVAWVTTSHDPRAVLWFTAVCSAVVALPLLWMGPLPQDMPSARDPACRHHPQYERVAHRGRIAGSIMVIAIVASVALSMAFVDGL